MKNSTSIPVNNRFEIRSDNHGFILVEHVPTNPNHHKSTGKGTREIHKYYGSVEQCCQAILSESGKEACSTAQDLIYEWRNAIESVKEVFEND